MIDNKWPIPNRLNLVITAGQISLSLWCLYYSSNASSTLGLVVAAVIFSFIMQTGFSLLHEAEHSKLHSNKKINDLLGFLLAAMFPGSFQLMKVAHLNHHGVNRSDAELVDYIKPDESNLYKTAQFYLLICGLIWVTAPLVTLLVCLTPTKWLSTGFAKVEETAVSRYLAFIQRAEIGRARIETATGIVLWVLVWQLLQLNFIGVLLCYLAFAFSWSSQQYIYHVRTPRHLIEGAYDLKLWQPMQWLYLNFNFHLQHHRYPKVAWLYMNSIGSERPIRSYLTTYLALWQPPQPVAEAWPVDFQRRGPLLPRPEITWSQRGLAQ